jgi:excisionase family DNA binding protein
MKIMYNQLHLMHVADAASLLGVSSQIIYKLIRLGALNAFKDGRAWKISVQSVNDYIQARLNQ